MITICDTGPLVAYLNRNDPYHSWAMAVMKQVRPPALTCESVLTEKSIAETSVSTGELTDRSSTSSRRLINEADKEGDEDMAK